ncbi:centromere kinetochore component CENP-T domain-containing protein [Trichoderma chlorosporum]
MSLNLDFYPEHYFFDYHPEGPTFNYWRRQFLDLQDSFRPPGEPGRELSPEDSEPSLYPCSSTSPSPPSSIATMDLEMLDMGRIDNDDVPVHTPPRRRTRSVEPSTTRLSIHTPSDRYFQNPHYPHSTVQTPAAPTPHAVAARRALDQRRIAMFTPGRTRRQSIREQRETPMSILRHLGRALAPTSHVIASSSSPDKSSPNGGDNGGPSGSGSGSGSGRRAPSRRGDDDDDELPIDRPRLSLPLDEGSSDDLQPPQSSMLDDGNVTVQSVELPRRATSEGPPRRSFGFLPGSGDDIIWDDIYGEHTGSDPFGRSIEIAPPAPLDPEIADLRRPPGDRRESDFSLDMPSGLSDNDQTTFYMRSPVIDDIHAVLEAPNPVADDIKLMNEKRQAEVEKTTAQEDDDQFPDYGDFASVSSLGDAEMEAVTKIDFETLGLEPEKPNDDIIGYPHGRPKKKKVKTSKARISRHNIEYPQLPPAFVRQVTQAAMQTTGLLNQRITADTLGALTQASDWYFQQLGDDLGAYANHAGRRTIEERDVITLMNRQRILNPELSLFNLANRHLPRELQQMLRYAIPVARPGMLAAHAAQAAHAMYAANGDGGLKRKREEDEDDEDDDDEEEELVFPEDEDEEEEEEEEEDDEQ